jgi:nucleoside-diphosphate-sugar epimerase
MKVLVTGANGLIGAVTVSYLLERGYDVRAVDLTEDTKLNDVEYAPCDIRDYDAVRKQVRGCDAVVHLAALPSPTFATGPTTFHINVTGTYNVFEATAQEGIKRIAQASSVNAIGFTWNVTDFVPEYFPVDEKHRILVSDPYSLSKQLIEEIGTYYWRRDGISSVALRLPGVNTESFYKSKEYIENRDAMSVFMDEFVQKPEAEQQRLLTAVRKRVLAFRADRLLEFGTQQAQPTQKELGDIPLMLWEMYMWQRFMLWSSVDVRDSAQAFEKSLKADFEGSNPLFINDNHNFMMYDIRTLARLFFPDVTTWKEDLNGTDALLSIKKAQELIGFEPVYSVRDVK